MTTTYYSSSDEQTERINQTVETAIRCLLIEKYEEKWATILSEIEYALNTFENVSIKSIFFEALYEVRSRDSLLSLTFKSIENLARVDFLRTR
jgi:hypothetical protein